MTNGAPSPVASLVEQLRAIAFNLAWSWRPEAVSLFMELGPKLWDRSDHNPVRALMDAEESRLAELAQDRSFVERVEREAAALREHLAAPAWFQTKETSPGHEWPAEDRRALKIAYFCAEFGLAACLPIYAGGLGLLAGDHLKSAAGLGLPFVGVGLLYHWGYFRQRLDATGRQMEVYRDIEPGRQPIRRCTDTKTGRQLRVRIELPGRSVEVGVWRCDVGRAPLYLLDTDLPENEPRDREITRNLYLGDHDMRIRQELVLGIGGVRALVALGENATVFHMNEGHSAFLALERIRAARARLPLSFDQAREAIAAGNLFTTHTPVPAGIDRFAPSLVSTYLAPYQHDLGLDAEGILALGRENVADRSEAFSMAVLAIRTSRWCNGVSRLHGRVSRGMWRNIWPGVPVDDVPIGHVTNGVFASGWIGERAGQVFDSAAGRSWREHQDDPRAWERIADLPDEAIWRMRQQCRDELVHWVRRRQLEIATARGADEAARALAGSLLNPALLTIGFARRFAQYKRGTLLFRDPDRLEQLLRAERGIQIIVAGKAHPGDHGGKELLRSIVRFARERRVEDRVVVLEDYDIDVARRLVQGCDIWLNTPIRGLEASGTSGMKAAMNGCIHVSTLDGWWDEGYSSDVGYHIESAGIFDHDMPDDNREEFESEALYRLLEHQIIPKFYERARRPDATAATGSDPGVPARWVEMVRQCILTLSPRFSTHRMVKEYALKYYFPAHNAATRLEADSFAGAVALSDRIARFRRYFGGVRVNTVQTEISRGASRFDVTAVVELGELRPDEVGVQLQRGLLDRSGELAQADVMEMTHEKNLHDGGHRYRAQFTPMRSSREAWVVRVLPRDKLNIHPYIPGLIVSGALNRVEAHLENHG